MRISCRNKPVFKTQIYCFVLSSSCYQRSRVFGRCMSAYGAEEFPGDSEILMKLRNDYRKRGVNEILVNENASQKLKFRKFS